MSQISYKDLSITDRLSTARIGLLMRQPFFGNMATRMQLIENNTWCKTAATNGVDFFYNTNFVSRLTIGELQFLFAHEILHAALDHIGRRGNRKPKLANIAQDYAVNQILVDDSIGTPITNGFVEDNKGQLHAIKLLQDNKYRELAWEEIYDMLLKDMPKFDAEKFLETLDQHFAEKGIADEDGDDDGMPDLSPSELAEMRDKLKSSLVQAAASAGLDKTPDIIKRLIGSWSAPTINWKELVQQEIKSLIGDDYSFKRPNRRASSMGGAILPRLIPRTAISVVIALDMSGSISDEDSSIFLSEVQGIVEQFNEYTIDIWCFDTKVMNHKTFTQHSGEPITSYNLVGGGGTDFDVNFDYMKQNDITPKKFIMFTDGYPGGSWGDPNYTDTIFIVKGNSNAKSPFGQTIIYEQV